MTINATDRISFYWLVDEDSHAHVYTNPFSPALIARGYEEPSQNLWEKLHH